MDLTERFDEQPNRKVYLLIVGLVCACLMLIALLTYVIGFRSDPIVLQNGKDQMLTDKLVGTWQFKDLRVSNPQLEPITFHESGILEQDPTYQARWFCSDGIVYLFTRRIDDVNEKDQMFPVIPTFDKSNNTVQLAFPGQPPHAVLSR